jgi:tyrosine-protein kinase Etk/Wzc
MDRIIAIAPLWERVWAARRRILVLVFSATVVTGVLAFVLPPWYLAESELLPPGEEDSGMGVASLLRGIGVPGVKIPTQVSPGDVFIVVLQSRRIAEQVVHRFDLMKLYKKRYMTDAIRELRRHAHFKLTEAGTIRISVEDMSRQRAADIANAYVEFLDRFNREVRMTKGRRMRLFIEGRLSETKGEMAAAEQRLAEYQSQHKAVALTPQMSSAVDEAARLAAARATLEVRLGVIRSYSRGSDAEIQIQQELTEMDRQMRNLPAMGLELARLVRDVKVLEQVFTILTAQYEEARITEARDVTTVDVLDAAALPERKARPKRGTMIGAAFLLSLALGVGAAILPRREQRVRAVRAASAG